MVVILAASGTKRCNWLGLWIHDFRRRGDSLPSLEDVAAMIAGLNTDMTDSVQ